MNFHKNKLSILIIFFSFHAFGQAHILWIPCKVWTYSPITITDINERYWVSWKINNFNIENKIQNILLNGEKKKFNPSQVRGAFHFNGKIFYIDSQGVATIDKINGVKVDEKKIMQQLIYSERNVKNVTVFYRRKLTCFSQ